MEPDRVEMSVGSGMVNGDHLANGTAANGSTINAKSQGNAPSSENTVKTGVAPYTNGETTLTRGIDEIPQTESSILQDAPPELLQALSSEFYLPMARLVSRSAQSCWNDMLDLVERLSSMPVPAQASPNGVVSSNDQSKVNLDKKDLLLNFAKVHKDIFIKLLVLLQWSRRSAEVRKTIELNLWLQQRRQAFNNATGMFGAMMRGLADSQIPNPDLYTAGEVLATGNVSSMPKLDYVPQPPLSAKQILKLLRRLDVILCTRMALADDIPAHLQNYNVHDGRVTFTIKDEFAFDVSVASEDPTAKFGIVDFRFLFSPAPSIPDGLHDEITRIANAALDKDGFSGLYDFLHDLTLSYMLNELARQARKLSSGLWNGHLKVEVHRRTLVIQYWLKTPLSKSWLEIGIHSGRQPVSQNGELRNSITPELKLRWLREGKLEESDVFKIESTYLSVEEILRQAIAQHTNELFDAIYDKLILFPVYGNAELDLNQTFSSQNPGECTLLVQLSKTDVLNISMEPIGGSLILSPVSERTNKVQSDLAKSKNIVDDFVSRVSGLRSSIAESNLMKSLSNSQWQRYEGVRFGLAEAERVFGQPVVRISFIHLNDWNQAWMLAITQSMQGDVWWLVHTAQPNRLIGSRITKIVDNHPLYTIGHPTPAYLEKLADYTTGVIALQSNAQYLSQNGFTWRLPDILSFDSDTRLPALQFTRRSALDLTNARPLDAESHKKSSEEQQEANAFVHLKYHGLKQSSQKVVVFATTQIGADLAVLRDLASSELDSTIAILPEKQQLLIRMESDPGSPVIEGLIHKIAHLENIVACAAAVKKSAEHELKSLSLSSLTILYHKNPDLSLLVNFGQSDENLDVSFLPVDTNPQQHLSQWIVKFMKRKGQNARRSLSNVFVVLRMTLPIMTYLQQIQTQADVANKDMSGGKDNLRIHILHRQPTSYGLQYFANSSNFVHDETEHGTPKKLLARFEILAMKNGERLMWIIRPSIEEFSSYNRPSYTSKALRDKLDQEIFRKKTPQWLSLDGGAACPSEKPEQLMSAIHDTISAWAKDAIKPETAGAQDSKATNASSTGKIGDKPASKPNAVPQKPQNAQNAQNAQNSQQRPNGVQRPQQSSGQSRPQNFNNRNQGPRPSEVITLD